MRVTEEQRWMIASAGSAIVAAVITRTAAQTGWKKALDSNPPKNPAAAGTTWRQAIAWGLGSGMIVGLSRVLAERLATGGWRKVTGHTPRPLRW